MKRLSPSSALRRRRCLAATPLCLAWLSLAVLSMTILSTAAAHAASPSTAILPADWDDDDADGVPDAEQPLVQHQSDLLVLDPPKSRDASARRVELGAGAGVRVLVDGRPWTSAELIPRGARSVAIQATEPGRSMVRIGERDIEVRAVGVVALDQAGTRVDLARSHASLERTPPAELGSDAPGDASGLAESDPDALQYVLVGAAEDVPDRIRIQSWSADGEMLAQLDSVALQPVSCPAFVQLRAGMRCMSTEPIRVVAEGQDARHPLSAHRSVLGEIGGGLLLLREQGPKLALVRIAGPRQTALGTLARYRARLRVLLVRLAPRGPLPLGAGEAAAVTAAREAVQRASALWGACGVSFGPEDQLDVQVVDPPPPYLLVLGCSHGLPAAGGAVRFRADGRAIEVALRPGLSPRAAARQVAAAVRAAGFVAKISDNPPVGSAALGSTDVGVFRSSGRPAHLDRAADGTLSTDPAMSVCIGAVNLDDGLDHFGDVDAVVGTVEERTLVRAYDDNDPATIEVLVVPGLSAGDRIGESFIGSDGGSIRNTVIVDRAGLSAGRGASALAHELGHVLLDDPGHPDDFGTDTPTRLMDADADDPTAFGPSRLTKDECVRVVRQSGPAAPVVLLRPWPLAPLDLHAAPPTIAPRAR